MFRFSNPEYLYLLLLIPVLALLFIAENRKRKKTSESLRQSRYHCSADARCFTQTAMAEVYFAIDGHHRVYHHGLRPAIRFKVG